MERRVQELGDSYVQAKTLRDVFSTGELACQAPPKTQAQGHWVRSIPRPSNTATLPGIQPMTLIQGPITTPSNPRTCI